MHPQKLLVTRCFHQTYSYIKHTHEILNYSKPEDLVFWKTTFIFLSWLCYFGYMPGSHSSPFLSLSNLVHSFSSASCQIPITALKPFYCRLPLFSYVYCCGHLTSDLLAHSLISLYFILNMRCIHSPYLVPVSFIQSYAYHSPDSAFVPEMLNYLMLFCISGF